MQDYLDSNPTTRIPSKLLITNQKWHFCDLQVKNTPNWWSHGLFLNGTRIKTQKVEVGHRSLVLWSISRSSSRPNSFFYFVCQESHRICENKNWENALHATFRHYFNPTLWKCTIQNWENASCGHVCDMEVFPQLVRPHPPSLFTPSCHPPQHGNLCQTNCFKTFCFSLVSLGPAQKEHLMVILEST